jgi:hypothetical protein
MANSLGITASSFGNAAGKRFLGDVAVEIALHDATTGQSGTFYNIGYCDPEKTFSSKRDYIELNTGVPESLVAKDCIKITNSIKTKIKQFQTETFALCMGAEVDSAGTNARVVLGTDLPTALECSIILSGETKDGKDLKLYIRRAQITPETVEIALGSVKEYGTLNFEAAILADEHPLETNWGWPVISEKDSADDAASMAGASPVITIAATTGWSVGMYVYSAVNGFLGIIDSIQSNTSLTLDRNCAAESTVTIKGVTTANIERDNIAYFEFEVV